MRFGVIGSFVFIYFVLLWSNMLEMGLNYRLEVSMGIAKLISLEWELEWEWLDGNGSHKNSTFSHFQSEEENQPVSCATSASPGTSADSETLDCHRPPAKKRRVFDVKRVFTL